MPIELNAKDLEVLREVFDGYGDDCPGGDWKDIQELRYKLGFDRRPTPEELSEQERKRKELIESNSYKQMIELINQHSYIMNAFSAVPKIAYGIIDIPIGTELKIALPNDFITKDTNNG